MKESLINAIKEIRNNKSISTMDEASVISVIVERILSLLGWNIHDDGEVKHEHSLGSKAVDFSLRIGGVSKAIIEAKRGSEKLALHQRQILDYAFYEGVKLAILTNGIEWWFYLPLIEANWEQRKFLTLDLMTQKLDGVAESFINLLSKDNVVSGKALTNAEILYKNRAREEVIRTSDGEVDGTEKIIWTEDKLRSLFKKMPNRILGDRLEKVLSWASQKGILLENNNPGMARIRIGNKSKDEIALFRVNGEIFFYLLENRYSKGKKERDQLIIELREIGLIFNLSMNAVKEGSSLKKKLNIMSEDQFKKLIEIIHKYCE